ncbi:hypothetical protein EYF80_033295 [Liparis tanakae]|uniref:Uncharacterized protein n=1 Tax=Liparis tanakae TaxID=230148 RepID=A0A4Z2GS58_9TELE|nr:hypothetical protein EYF80_033295 [Liparis tanakae]
MVLRSASVCQSGSLRARAKANPKGLAEHPNPEPNYRPSHMIPSNKLSHIPKTPVSFSPPYFCMALMALMQTSYPEAGIQRQGTFSLTWGRDPVSQLRPRGFSPLSLLSDGLTYNVLCCRPDGVLIEEIIKRKEN